MWGGAGHLHILPYKTLLKKQLKPGILEASSMAAMSVFSQTNGRDIPRNLLKIPNISTSTPKKKKIVNFDIRQTFKFKVGNFIFVHFRSIPFVFQLSNRILLI